MNTLERTVRAGGHYREPFDSFAQREQIRKLLSRRGESQIQSSKRNYMIHRTSMTELTLHQAMRVSPVPETIFLPDERAFAIFDRGTNYPRDVAMSGFTLSFGPEELENQLWTDKANEVRRFFNLEEDCNKACHVEQRILTYLVFHHTLWNVNPETRKLLRPYVPPVRFDPEIFVSKAKPCSSCREFIKQFEGKFPEVRFTIHFGAEIPKMNNAHSPITLSGALEP